jgi:hypothetical protein
MPDVASASRTGTPVSTSILIMDVHLSFGVNPQGPTTPAPFAPNGLYELKIDLDGDAVADLAFRVSFSSAGGAWISPGRAMAANARERRREWTQAERGARPQQEPFLAGDDKAACLAGEPATDARFIAAFAHSLEHLGGYSPADATRVAGTFLPDILIYDPKRPASFPGNGRSFRSSPMEDHG